MGKRRKSCINENLSANEKRKNKKNKLEDNSNRKKSQPDRLNRAITNKSIKNYVTLETLKSEPEKIITPSQNEINKDDTKRNNEFNENNDDSLSNFEILKSNSSSATKKNKCNKNKPEVYNRKIIFNEDEPVEVKNETNNQNKTNKKELTQEEDVKDEDIDKFCDEINEEDNVQYENWVKLIEAKLNSNKKKPT